MVNDGSLKDEGELVPGLSASDRGQQRVTLRVEEDEDLDYQTLCLHRLCVCPKLGDEGELGDKLVFWTICWSVILDILLILEWRPVVLVNLEELLLVEEFADSADNGRWKCG